MERQTYSSLATASLRSLHTLQHPIIYLRIYLLRLVTFPRLWACMHEHDQGSDTRVRTQKNPVGFLGTGGAGIILRIFSCLSKKPNKTHWVGLFKKQEFFLTLSTMQSQVLVSD